LEECVAPPDLDLNVMFERASVQVEPTETDDERAARLRREGAEARYEIVKGYVVFFLVVLALIAVGVLCAYESFFDATASADTRRWAQTTLSALFAGSVSFVLGQATAKKGK
jgi:hypothetical protein